MYVFAADDLGEGKKRMRGVAAVTAVATKATVLVYNERRPRVHDVCPAKKGIRVSGIYAEETLSVCFSMAESVCRLKISR